MLGLAIGFFGVAAAVSTPYGQLEPETCEFISGWAWDPAQPTTPVTVALFDGPNLVASARADRYRADLVEKITYWTGVKRPIASLATYVARGGTADNTIQTSNFGLSLVPTLADPALVRQSHAFLEHTQQTLTGNDPERYPDLTFPFITQLTVAPHGGAR